MGGIGFSAPAQLPHRTRRPPARRRALRGPRAPPTGRSAPLRAPAGPPGAPRSAGYARCAAARCRLRRGRYFSGRAEECLYGLPGLPVKPANETVPVSRKSAPGVLGFFFKPPLAVSLLPCSASAERLHKAARKPGARAFAPPSGCGEVRTCTRAAR